MSIPGFNGQGLAEFDLNAFDLAMKEKQSACKHEHFIDGFWLHVGGDRVCQNCLKSFTYTEYAEMQNMRKPQTVR